MDDVVTVDANGKSYVTNKVEIRSIIHQYVESEFGKLADSATSSGLIDVKDLINDKMEALEKEIVAYFEFKVNKITESLVEKMLTHHFENEVNNRVEKKLLELGLDTKKIKGNF
jgi:hypothetical protein